VHCTLTTAAILPRRKHLEMLHHLLNYRTIINHAYRAGLSTNTSKKDCTALSSSMPAAANHNPPRGEAARGGGAVLNHPQQQLAGSIAAASNLPPGYTTHAAHLAVLATHRLAAYNCKKKHPTNQCPAALLLLHQGLSHPLIGPFMQLSEHQCAANMHLPRWVPTTHLEEDKTGPQSQAQG
jgi:hypothetical protein